MKATMTVFLVLAAVFGVFVLYVQNYSQAQSQSSEAYTTYSGQTYSSQDLPDWLTSSPTAYKAYQQASQVMTDTTTTAAQKQNKMQVLQQTNGQEIMAAVVRYVPVYDGTTRKVVSFDNYMREMASEYSTTGQQVPMSYDPVGAATILFFDPSPQNIAALTGIGLSQAEVQSARANFDNQQQQRANQEANLIKSLQSAYSGIVSAISGSSGMSSSNSNPSVPFSLPSLPTKLPSLPTSLPNVSSVLNNLPSLPTSFPSLPSLPSMPSLPSIPNMSSLFK